MSGKRYTPEQIAFIKANYLNYPIKKIARLIGGSGCGVGGVLKRNNLEQPKELIAKFKKESYFKKGFSPANKGKKQYEFLSAEGRKKVQKTQFKKGHTPHNAKYNGAERITREGYVQIRVAQGDYRLKHILNWEKVNGPLPEGYCLSCKDGNKQNTAAENWEPKLKGEIMLQNSRYHYPEEVIPSMAIRSKIITTIKTLENGTK